MLRFEYNQGFLFTGIISLTMDLNMKQYLLVIQKYMV
jgi:hypothetical protein